MQIQKVEHNKWIGVAAVFAALFILATAATTFEYAGGAFILIVGFLLWWINR